MSGHRTLGYSDSLPEILAGTYRIEEPLGSGGMGTVYKARNVRTDGSVAIKLLRREAADNPEIFRRFQEEARIGSALRHPHIVHVIDFNQDEAGRQFIVMEYLEGEDLAKRLEHKGRLSLDETLGIARQVGSALQAAHDRGVVHRDIKPQNIFLVRAELAHGLTDVAKILDFGISKIRRTDSQVTRELSVLGTPQFMSPEAAQGRHSELDGRSDQFSLAVILYRALSGQLPFDGDPFTAVLYQVIHEPALPLERLIPGLPPAVIAAIERAMCKRKEDRFPSMREFLRALNDDVRDTQDATAAPDEAAMSRKERSTDSLRDGSSSSPQRPVKAPSASSLSLATGQPELPARRSLPVLRVLAAGVILAAGSAVLTRTLRPRPAPEPRAGLAVDAGYAPTPPPGVAASGAAALPAPADAALALPAEAVDAAQPTESVVHPPAPPPIVPARDRGGPSVKDGRGRTGSHKRVDDEAPLFPASRPK